MLGAELRARAGEGDIDGGTGRDVALAGGGFGEEGFDALLERVEALAEGAARFCRGGFQPGIADRFEAALLTAEPFEAEVLDRVSAVERGGGVLQIGGQQAKGLVQRGIVVAAEFRDRNVGHG